MSVALEACKKANESKQQAVDEEIHFYKIELKKLNEFKILKLEESRKVKKQEKKLRQKEKKLASLKDDEPDREPEDNFQSHNIPISDAFELLDLIDNHNESAEDAIEKACGLAHDNKVAGVQDIFVNKDPFSMNNTHRDPTFLDTTSLDTCLGTSSMDATSLILPIQDTACSLETTTSMNPTNSCLVTTSSLNTPTSSLEVTFSLAQNTYDEERELLKGMMKIVDEMNKKHLMI